MVNNVSIAPAIGNMQCFASYAKVLLPPGNGSTFLCLNRGVRRRLNPDSMDLVESSSVSRLAV